MPELDISWLLPFFQQMGHLLVDHIWTILIGGGTAYLVSDNFKRFKNDDYVKFREAEEYVSFVRRQSLGFSDAERSDCKTYLLEFYKASFTNAVNDGWNATVPAAELELRKRLIDPLRNRLKKVRPVREAFDDFEQARDGFFSAAHAAGNKNDGALTDAALRMKLSWFRFFELAFEPHSQREFERLMGLSFRGVGNFQGLNLDEWKYVDDSQMRMIY
jgi:hypothetical protein